MLTIARTRRCRAGIGLFAVGAALATALPAHAAAQHGRVAARPQSVTLDSREARNDGAAGPIATRTRLARGASYLVTVRGTFSYYPAATWLAPVPPLPVICGRPEPAPVFGTPGRSEGPVGFDAERIFAFPTTQRDCDSMSLPVAWKNFQVSAGGSFAHPRRVRRPRGQPARPHTYHYRLRGRGRPARFRLRDSHASDNYGLLRISVRAARPSR